MPLPDSPSLWKRLNVFGHVNLSVSAVHPELKPCLKINQVFWVFFLNAIARIQSHWILEINWDGLFPLWLSRCYMTYQSLLGSCVVLLLFCFFCLPWPAGELPASSCSPQRPLCLSWVSITCHAGCRAERLVNRWLDGTVDFISLCPLTTENANINFVCTR